MFDENDLEEINYINNGATTTTAKNLNRKANNLDDIYSSDSNSSSNEAFVDDYFLALQLQMQKDEFENYLSGDDNGEDLSDIKANKEKNKKKAVIENDEKAIVKFSSSSSSWSSQSTKYQTIIDRHLLNDPELDLIDPCPDIRAMFVEFDKKYFFSRLGSCLVEWSKRMTICAGIFYLREGGIIRLSEPLLKYRPRKDLVETLLHEMIHAYLYLTRNFKDRESHGDEFKAHMERVILFFFCSFNYSLFK